MIGRLRKTVVERDRIVIFEENRTADIAVVYDRDDTTLYASSATQEYAVPLGDVQTYVGDAGRIYLLGAEPDYVRDTERLAALEKSIVLRQITMFQQPPDEKNGLNVQKIMLYALIGILLLAVVFK